MKPLPLSLYQITEELALLEEALDSEGAELAQEKMPMLVELIQQKTDNVVGFRNYMDDQVAMIDARIDELSAYKKALNNQMKRMDIYVASCLTHLGTQKIEGKLSTISRRTPVMVAVILDQDQLPLEFLRTVVEPEKKKILDALKAGDAVPGAVMERSASITMSYANRKPLTGKKAKAEAQVTE